MRKKWLNPLLIVAAIALMFSMMVGCSDSEAQSQTKVGEYDTGLDPEEWNSYAYKDLFPVHWESNLKNMENQKDVVAKSDESVEPMLPILFNGFGFAKDYNLTRGHTFAYQDQMETHRIMDNPNATTNCMSCKSSLWPQMQEEFGDDVWSMNYHDEAMPWLEEVAIPDEDGELGTWGHVSIGCSTCHDPVTMDLRITLPQLTLSLENKGVDLDEISQHDMRSLVCAQCHVEYFFDPTNNGHTTMPWDNGYRIEDSWEFYEEKYEVEGEFQGEYVSTLIDTPILKAQHPEFEMWSYGPHQDVSCADCHMPYQRIDGKKKISSHRWGTPLETIEESCRTCHGDRSAKDLEDRVLDIQERHKNALLETQDYLVEAYYYVNRMITLDVDADKTKEAQDLIRKSHYFMDMVAAENGYGFHNPDAAIEALREALKDAQDAINIATIELIDAGQDIDELNSQIEETIANVVNEPESLNRHEHATNEWFPNHRDN